jgi:4-hydroxythreonine-4-phosphate dehydrogenase
MIFKNNNLNVLLISDHIAINEIPEYITSELIFDKTETTILNYLKYYSELDQVIFSGINPHVGENGTIGTEDQVIAPAIDKLQNKYKEIDFLGPYSGDVLSSYRNNKKQLLVYMFHDQGLSYFKGINGLLGLNISFGLPFLRLSVDHGTALELNGKGIANPIGCLNLLKESINIHKNLDIL